MVSYSFHRTSMLSSMMPSMTTCAVETLLWLPMNSGQSSQTCKTRSHKQSAQALSSSLRWSIYFNLTWLCVMNISKIWISLCCYAALARSVSGSMLSRHQLCKESKHNEKEQIQRQVPLWVSFLILSCSYKCICMQVDYCIIQLQYAYNMHIKLRS